MLFFVWSILAFSTFKLFSVTTYPCVTQIDGINYQCAFHVQQEGIYEVYPLLGAEGLQTKLDLYVPTQDFIRDYGRKLYEIYLDREIFYSGLLRQLGLLTKKTWKVIIGSGEFCFVREKGVQALETLPDGVLSEEEVFSLLCLQGKNDLNEFFVRHSSLIIAEFLFLALHGIYLGDQRSHVSCDFIVTRSQIKKKEPFRDDVIALSRSIVFSDFRAVINMDAKRAFQCSFFHGFIENLLVMMGHRFGSVSGARQFYERLIANLKQDPYVIQNLFSRLDADFSGQSLLLENVFERAYREVQKLSQPGQIY